VRWDFEDPEKACLAGLLHDLGYIVNMVLFPQQEKAALENALQTGEFLGSVEYEKFGFSHCLSGEVPGRFWNFSDDLIEVILCHHNASAALINPGLVAHRLPLRSSLPVAFSRSGLCGSQRSFARMGTQLENTQRGNAVRVADAVVGLWKRCRQLFERGKRSGEGDVR